MHRHMTKRQWRAWREMCRVHNTLMRFYDKRIARELFLFQEKSGECQCLRLASNLSRL